MTTKQQYNHLQIYSEYSIESSLLTIDDIISLAEQSNMQSVALTDIGNVFALVKFYQAAIKKKIKPIVGAELRIVDAPSLSADTTPSEQNKQKTYKLIVLCQDRQGYNNLSTLMTESFMSGQIHGVPHISRSWLTSDNTKGLIAIEPGHTGFSSTYEIDSVADLQPWLSLFDNRYYLGIHRLQTEPCMRWEKRLRKLSTQQVLPIVALNQVCFAQRQDHAAHEVRACIQAGQVLDARDGELFSPDQYWRSQEEMLQLFSDMPEALENTLEITKRCNLSLQFDQVFLPNFPIEKGDSLDTYLEKLSFEGIEQRWPQIQKLAAGQDKDNNQYTEFSRKDYESRLRTELSIIHQMGFAGYFLIVADFIQWGKNNDVAVGPGRGSGAGSLVAYVLKITDIDPLPHGLLFERFLNPERVSMPDFDVDFCMINRDRVIAYVRQHYGRESVAQISTHGSMAAKAAVRDVGRAMAHPYGFVDKVAKLIPNDLGITLPVALKQSPDLSSRYKEDDQVKALLDMAMTLEGRVRNVGRHAGGVVIAPGKLTDFCPLYKENGSPHQATQFDMGDVEKVGLVKFDFLGLRTLTIIDSTVKSVNKNHQDQQLDITNIPLDDVKTYQLLQSCRTTAVFQLESRGFQELIGRLLPDCFADIVALVALYRPGPLQSGMVDDFIDRKHGRAKVVYLHPSIETILQETYGVIVYQEQVMQIAQVMAGYTLGAADLLRRAMGKKKPEEMAKQRTIFLEGSKKNNIDAEVAEKVFDLMEMFAGYGFNKSHSVAYAMISYQTAYLKAHWLDYFMASVLSSDMDNTDKVVHYVKDCLAFGLQILPPCINRSKACFHVEKRGAIRYGLGAIKGVGEGFALHVETFQKSAGQSQVFSNMLDFCIKLTDAKVNKKVVEALIWSGAMDALGQSRGTLLASIEIVLSQKDQYARNQTAGQGDLFSMDEEEEIQCQYATSAPNWGLKEALSAEFSVLGQYFSGHPIDPYKIEIRQLQANKVARIKPSPRKTKIKLIGLVSKQRRMTTKAGRLFVMIELMDDSGSIEIACFDDKVQQLQLALMGHEVVVIEGTVQEARHNGQARYNIDSIMSLEQYRQMKSPTLHIKVNEKALSTTTAKEVKTLLSNQESGQSRVVIWYRAEGKEIPLAFNKPLDIVINEALMTALQHVQGVDTVEARYEN